MNLFSQSKLTLKLKKTNSSLSNTHTNVYQKSTTSDVLKSENLSNNSTTSENDSFVEILHTSQSQTPSQITMSQNVFKSSPYNQNVTNIINKNKQCPVCLQMIDVKNFINHVKSCGTSHNLTSEVLIKAVNLQERQAAEREALGLPKSTKCSDLNKKKSNVKQTKLKIGSDSNLDLAIAMSVSLQESKEAEIIKESETLLEAGLENEAIEKRKTLESFGFISNQPIKSKLRNFSKNNSMLFKQTKEDREKRITEKVAMILIDFDTNASSSLILVNNSASTKIRSEYLNKIRNNDNELWQKSLLEVENICKFYVNNLSKFIIPCESNSSTDLYNCSKFSVHYNTEKKESNTINNESMDTVHSVVGNSNVDNISATSLNINGNKTIPEYSSKWKLMLGNKFMSDISIFTKDEHEIPVHSLVLYVQCADILDDIIIEESNTCKSKKMIMWLEYSYKACLAFLEFIYSGQESFVSPKYRDDYLHLGRRYNILIAINDDENGWFSKEQDNISKRKNTEFYNSPIDCKRYKASSPDMFMSDDDKSNFLGLTVNDEKSLSVLKTKQWLFDCNISQHHNSLFTEINSPPETNLSEKSPSHSFHSASTVSLPVTYMPNNIAHKNNYVNINSFNIINSSPKSLTDKSSVQTIAISDKIESFSNATRSLAEMTKLTKLSKEPEVITINSDSESLDMNITTNINENNVTPLLKSSFKKEKINNSTNTKWKNNLNTMCTTTIELSDDDSLNSINLSNTNILKKTKQNAQSYNYLSHNLTVLSPKVKPSKNMEDKSSVFSTVTNVLHTNNINTQKEFFNDIIYLDDNSLDSVYTVNMTGLLKNDGLLTTISKPTNIAQNDNLNIIQPSELFSSVTSNPIDLSPGQTNLTMDFKTNNLILNSPPKCNLLTDFELSNSNISPINLKSTEDFDYNLTKSSSKQIVFKDNPNEFLTSLNKSFQNKNISSTFINNISCTQINSMKCNDTVNNSHDEKDILDKSDLDSNLLDSKLILSSNYFDDLYLNIKKDFNSTVENINKYTSIKSISTQVEPIQPSEINNISQTTIINVNSNRKKQSNYEQIIEDPWIDYNDWQWQSVNISPQYVSPGSSKNITAALLNESEQKTPEKEKKSQINLNAVTPNKYGSKIKTPKSLRRVQSESTIGFKEQLTPLPDYSAMKTPDLRKEFDRYGLKDLGRNKGKLILRHIYDVLHPLHKSKETVYEQNYDSSDSSNCGIPDYEDGSHDELDTFSQTNLTNKISIEMGFEQLLKANEEIHKKILFYEPIWIEELKENLKHYNVNISIQKLMTFLDDKCVTFRSKSLSEQRQKTLLKKNTKRKKLF